MDISKPNPLGWLYKVDKLSKIEETYMFDFKIYFNKIFTHLPCRNPNLGLMTKARACKGAGQEGSPGVWESVRMNIHTLKWAPILGIGVPVDSQIFIEQFQGSKPITLKSSLYHQKAIETWMSKMGSYDPFGYLKHKLWPKERSGTKLVVWLPTIKVGNRPNFLVFRWRATHCWKVFSEGYNFVLNLIPIGGLHTKLWGPKVAEVPTLVISGFPFGSPKTNCHLDVSLMNPIRCFVLCKFMWVSSCLSFFLVPSRSSNTPFYPQKCYELGNMPPTPNFSIVCILDSH